MLFTELHLRAGSHYAHLITRTVLAIHREAITGSGGTSDASSHEYAQQHVLQTQQLKVVPTLVLELQLSMFAYIYVCIYFFFTDCWVPFQRMVQKYNKAKQYFFKRLHNIYLKTYSNKNEEFILLFQSY